MGRLIPSAAIRRFQEHYPACQDRREVLPNPDMHRAAGMRRVRLALANTDMGSSARNAQTTEHAARQNPPTQRLLDSSAHGIAAQLRRKRRSQRPPVCRFWPDWQADRSRASTASPSRKTPCQSCLHTTILSPNLFADPIDRCFNSTMHAVCGQSVSDSFVGLRSPVTTRVVKGAGTPL